MDTEFKIHGYFPGIYHISDVTGVNFTLIVPDGQKRALLFDTGYGYLNPAPQVTELLAMHDLAISDLTVLMSHVHYDHLFGGRWFDSFYIHEKDFSLIGAYTSRECRERKLEQAREINCLPKDFDEDAFFNADYLGKARAGVPCIDGVLALNIPGHTPGSIVLYIPRYKLLLTADNWNPTTWLFFPEALPYGEYSKNMKALLDLDFSHVLCSHSGDLMPGKQVRDFIEGLVPRTFSSAVKTDSPYPGINTLLCHPEPGTNLVFRPL
ncbi:MBL fold metallo-hydrolase [Spirochaetia bacterium]|nr:MBL fold metallo-hydrolase [Spirochaetia bacterium]